ncbi:LysR family transcriptional regulator [Pseudomonas yamanorum]|uniref:LysR family transcriptional regulator n=1 Tax=Pseudomonas yamanorum TaxID=515393 RepID=A0A7Y8FES8_9PSED|nr:LysR family transcriptional regulator [Pseudomonas yamanorum]
MNKIHSKVENLDLNLLRVFEAVFQERHLTRAAEILSLTPSAVSHALRRLREYLDDPLFVRQGKAMVATPVCLRDAPALLDQLARLRQILQQWGRFDPRSTRQMFRIGMPEAVETSLMPALQTVLFEQAPNALFSSVAFDRAQMARMLASGRLDIIIDVALPIRDPVRHQPLLEDNFCVVARKGHPLGGEPNLQQYLDASHVAVSSRAGGLVLEDAALSNLGLQRPVALRCQTYVSAFAIVAASDHLLTVPEQLSRETPGASSLQCWRTPFQLPKVQLHLYWHSNTDTDPANEWLRNVVVSAVREHTERGARAKDED